MYKDRQAVNVRLFHEEVLGQVPPDEFKPFVLLLVEAAIRFHSHKGFIDPLLGCEQFIPFRRVTDDRVTV